MRRAGELETNKEIRSKTMNNNENERTEEDIVTQAEIKVVFGGDVYEIAPLVILYARPWRKQVSQLVAEVSGVVGTSSDDQEGFKSGMMKLLVDMPDTIIDLFFAYAKDLDRDEIEAKATEAEMAAAFGKVLAVAFPLATTLTTVVPAVQAPLPPNRVTRRKSKVSGKPSNSS